MRVDFITALQVFDLLPDRQKSPYFHPYYVVADALRDRELEPVFFIYKDGGEIFYYAFHLGKVPGSCFYDIQAPYGYGGPLSSSLEADFLARAWQAYFLWCQENNILAEFVRFHPWLENWRYYPGEIQAMRETVWIDLQPENDFVAYTTRVRTAIRKAQKNGLEVEWVKSDHGGHLFTQLYRQAMDRLQAERFYYFPEDYFRKLLAWQQAYLAICRKGEEVLAAALFLQESDMMEYHLSATTPEGNKWSASNLLLHESTVMARNLGCRTLHLGGGTDNRSDNPLLFFKSGFSTQRASFKIGKIIHADSAYQALQKDFQDQCGQCNDRILFYR